MESALPRSDTALAQSHSRRRLAGGGVVFFFVLGDLMVVTLSLFAAYWVRFESPLQDLGLRFGEGSLRAYWIHFYTAVAAMSILLYINGLYRMEILMRRRYGALLTLKPVFYWSAIFLFFTLGLRLQPEISRLFVAYAAGIMAVTLFTWRYFACRQLAASSWLNSLRKRVLVIDWNSEVEKIYQKSEEAPRKFYPLKISGVLTTPEGAARRDFPISHSAWEDVSGLENILETGKYDSVLVADLDLPLKRLRQIQESCAREMVEFMAVPNYLSTLRSCLHVESFGGVPLLTQIKRSEDHLSSRVLKRAFDIAGSLAGLVISAPIIAYFGWRVQRESPGPVFYRQTRTGRHNEPFEIVKIRSMRIDAEEESGVRWATKDDARRLEVGAFMRKYNIDELPQFWNVLKGEMSLVGPRPERPELIRKFKHQIDYYNIRHTIKPGMTGWAQVNGWRGDTCLKARIACDIEYIEHWSLFFDLYIILKTIRAQKNAH